MILGLSAAIASGVFLLEVETDFTRNFRRGTPIYESYEFVETKFGGAGVLDVIIPIKGLIEESTLEQAELMQRELLELEMIDDPPGTPALYTAISLADADRAARKFPAARLMSVSVRLRGMAIVMPSFVAAMYTPQEDGQGYRYFRIMLRTSQRQTSEQKAWLIDRIQESARKYFPPLDRNGDAAPQPQTTGFFVLLADIVNSVLADQKTTLLVADIGHPVNDDHCIPKFDPGPGSSGSQLAANRRRPGDLGMGRDPHQHGSGHDRGRFDRALNRQLHSLSLVVSTMEGRRARYAIGDTSGGTKSGSRRRFFHAGAGSRVLDTLFQRIRANDLFWSACQPDNAGRIVWKSRHITHLAELDLCII